MIRLITIMLYLSVSISVPAKGDHTAELRLDDPLIKESTKKSNQSETADPAKEVVAEKPNADTGKHQKPIEPPGAVETPSGKQATGEGENKPNGNLAIAGQTTEAQAKAIARSANDIAIDDFREQFRMAESANFMATVSFWQFLLGGFGSALLFWTLWETRRTANAAIAQAQQDRAWVLYARTEDASKYKIKNAIRLLIKNFGNTPAKNVRLSAALIECLEFDKSDPTDTYPFGDVGEITVGVLAPSMEFGKLFQLTDANWTDLRAKTARFFVYAKISYETVYGCGESEHNLELVPNFEGDKMVAITNTPTGPRNTAR